MNCAIIQFDKHLTKETIRERDWPWCKLEMAEIRVELKRLGSLLLSSRAINKAKVAARYDAAIARIRALEPVLHRMGIEYEPGVLKGVETMERIMDECGWREKTSTPRKRRVS